jgi:protein arginine kinase
MPDSIEKLLNNKVSFLTDGDARGEIAISSRIRLARNLVSWPFPVAAPVEKLEAVKALVGPAIVESGALGGDFLRFEPEKLPPIDREILFERRLVSRDFLARPHGTMLFARADESSSVMVNEEDHLRIQSLRPGFQLEAVWAAINELDDRLAAKLEYAFDGKIGFLTSCPTNVGTGMRASVMLHLPGLVLSGQINAAIQGIGKLNLAVRGIFGEGTDNRGNLFQISNQSTLGESENQIIERLSGVIRQVIAHEKNARNMLMEKEHYALLDHVGRSYGLLRYAYKLTSEEALNSLSGIRIGVDMGMFNTVDIATVNELLVITNPAHLQKFAKRALVNGEEDIFRASLLRERLKKREG